MKKILWISPNLNHYKARFLNTLSLEDDISLTVLSGSGREGAGDKYLKKNSNFKEINVKVNKKSFATSLKVFLLVKEQFSINEWVMIPAEKKNIILFLFAIWLRQINPKTKLFSYNHASIKSKNYIFSKLDNLISIFFYNRLDRVIFYNEYSSK